MSSSPESWRGESVLRGQSAQVAAAVSFGVDLSRQAPVDTAAVQRAKTDARTAGYAEGWAQGRQEAEVAAQAALDQSRAAEQARAADAAVALQQALQAVGRAAENLDRQVVGTSEELADLIVGYAVELAEGILGRELTEPSGRGADALRRVMAAAPDTATVTVRLHPDDYRTVADPATGGDYNFQGRLIRLRPDPGLQPGDAVAEAGATTVDATIATAMDRVREVLQQ